MARLIAGVGLAALLGALASAHSDEAPYAIMVSIDGLMPKTYTTPGPARIPTLRKLAAEGAWATGVIGVVPSVTYPSHTTMITGVAPAEHGIVDNRILDPEGISNQAWHSYAREIRVITLPGAVRSRGLRTGAVSWPASIGMDIDYLVPEYYPSRHPISALLLRALSKPADLWDSAELDVGRSMPWPLTDRARLDFAIHILKRRRPNLLLLHMFESDSAQHEHGPDSPQALEAIERLDGYLALLLDGATSAGLGGRVHVAVVSDHGFLPLGQTLHPNAAFKRQGLLTFDEDGKLTDWRAWFHSSGGSGYVYVRPADDPELLTRVAGVLQELAREPANGIATVWTAQDLQRLGAHPEAAFGIEMQPGFYSGSNHETLLTPSSSRGGHGFAPTRPELHASLILSGPRAAGVGNVGIVRMTQIAPTVASWFDVGLSPKVDQPLTLKPEAAPSR